MNRVQGPAARPPLTHHHPPSPPPSPISGALADIKNFASLVSPDHVVVLANAGATTESGRAWRDASAAGIVAWEGTLLESQARPDGDALVYGRFILPVAKGEAHIPAQP